MSENNDAVQIGITDDGVQHGNTGFLDSTECTRYYVNIPRAVDHFTIFANWYEKIEQEVDASRVNQTMQN